KTPLGKHCPKEEFQESWNRTFWESLSQKCDSIEQGTGDMAVSLIVHSGLQRENDFPSRGRALRALKHRVASKARPTIWAPVSSTFFVLMQLFFKERESLKSRYVGKASGNLGFEVQKNGNIHK